VVTETFLLRINISGSLTDGAPKAPPLRQAPNVSGKHMERYYNGGYYLIKRKPIDFGADKDKVVGTCSRCINFSVFDNWCLSWMSDKLDNDEKKDLELSDEKIQEIQKWTDSRFDNGSNVFPDIKLAQEFKDNFFNSRNDIEIYGLYFPETDSDLLLEEFAEGKNTKEFNYNNGDFGLRNNLSRKTVEIDNINEEFLGYDFIGVECDGSFHSFYCHDITQALIEKFTLTLNANGLFDKPERPNEIREYLNNPNTGLNLFRGIL
jgi:hypothetical protein